MPGTGLALQSACPLFPAAAPLCRAGLKTCEGVDPHALSAGRACEGGYANDIVRASPIGDGRRDGSSLARRIEIRERLRLPLILLAKSTERFGILWACETRCQPLLVEQTLIRHGYGGDGVQAFDILPRGSAKHAPILAAELRRAFVTNREARRAGCCAIYKHQTSGML